MGNIKPINIKIKNIAKQYGDKVVLEDINLKIKNDSFISILGKSGAGKSTLLNIISLIESYSKGEFMFNEINITKHKDYVDLRRQFVGIIFQSYNLISNLSCEENIILPLIYSNNNINKKYYNTLINELDLGEIEKKPVYMLSGGEKQRVAVARSLINNPSPIIADEPTGNLDKENKWGVFNILAREHKKGRAILIVTHDEELAGKSKNRYILSKGKLHENKKRATI